MAAPANQSTVSPSKEASQIDFLRRQFLVTVPTVSSQDVNLKGKTAIITGGNSGLGFHCGSQLLELGLSRLIITARNDTKGQEAKEKLCANKPADATVDVWPLDLSSYDSVQSFVNQVKELERVDIVIQNAASFATTFRLNSSTNHEEVVQVNYLSNVLLTILLLPVLQSKNSPGLTPTRLVWVNSETAAWAKFKERSGTSILAELDKKPSRFDFVERYYVSKLLCQFFLVELAKRVPPSVAVITMVNPGFCWGSGLHHETDGSVSGSMLSAMKRVIGRSTPEGARTLTDAAVNHGEEIHGQYLGDCKQKPMAPLLYQPEGAKLSEAIWTETMAELAFATPEDVLADLGE